MLIKAAGERLQAHWQALFAALGQVQRLRGFVRPLLADDLLAALVRVPAFFDEISPAEVAAHAPHWLAACGLPTEHLTGWQPAPGRQRPAAVMCASAAACTTSAAMASSAPTARGGRGGEL